MDIHKQLLDTHSKANTNLITSYIGTDSVLLDELMACFFKNEYRVSQRAAMVVSNCFDQHPILMQPYIEKMILNLESDHIHVAIKRNTIRILQFVDIPEMYQSQLFDRCLSFIRNRNEPIAVKAFSMTIVYNICKQYPELVSEVIPIIENEVNYTESKGIISRGKKVLAQLYRLSNC